MHVTDLVGGLFKASVYGALVAISGCLHGLQCGNISSAVGDAATSAVVTGIVFIISACGLFAVLFYVLGIWDEDRLMMPSLTADPDAYIIVRDLTMAYGTFVLMRDLTFTVKRADVFVIMGASGCGKSTLLRHLIGLNEPAKGEI